MRNAEPVQNTKSTGISEKSPTQDAKSSPRNSLSSRTSQLLERTMLRERQRASPTLSKLSPLNNASSAHRTPQSNNNHIQKSNRSAGNGTPDLFREMSHLDTSGRGNPQRSTLKDLFINIPANLSQSELNARVDAFLRETFEDRLFSMMQLRMKMEGIANAQRQEEQQYIQTINEIFKHQISEREKQQEKENKLEKQLQEVEAKYKKEYQEKLKTQSLFSSFRKSGSSIIQRLKHALEQIALKYKYEKHLNKQLTTKLSSLELHQQHLKPDETELLLKQKLLESKVISLKRALTQSQKELKSLRGQSNDETEHLDMETIENIPIIKLDNGQIVQNHSEQEITALESKCTEYKKLLDDDERVIQSLEEQIQQLEKENRKLRGVMKVQNIELNNDPVTEYMEIYNELKNFIDPEEEKKLNPRTQASNNPVVTIQAQNKLIKLLLARLKLEQKHPKEQGTKGEEKAFELVGRKITEVQKILDQNQEATQKDREFLKEIAQENSDETCKNISLTADKLHSMEYDGTCKNNDSEKQE